MKLGVGIGLPFLKNGTGAGGSLGPPVNVSVPVITGPAVVGFTLFASPGSWDGSGPITYAYQWQANGVNVGTNQNSYLIAAGDLGKTITVSVSATNSAGGPVIATSLATAAVQNPVAPTNSVAPVIIGNTLPGSMLQVDSPGSWSGWPSMPYMTYTYQWRRDGLIISSANNATYLTTIADDQKSIDCVVTANNGVAPNASADSNDIFVAAVYAPINTVAPVVTNTTAEPGFTAQCSQGTWSAQPPTGLVYAYQWYSGDTPISGATNNSYIITNADSNLLLKCQVSVTNSVGTGTPVFSNTIGPIVGVPIVTSAPQGSGSAVVGSTLSVTDGTWAGKTPITYTYQWQRSGVNVSGQTASTYLLTSADLGATIRCIVTATNTYGQTAYTTLSTPAVVAATVNPPVNTVLPAVTGTALIGSTLTCSQGTWTGDAPITYSYQWRRNGALISVFGSTYVLQLADVGATMSCMVTADNSGIGGASTFANSNSTAAISGGTAPVNSVAPVVSGATLEPGFVVTSTTGTWSASPASGITYTYQWYRNGITIAGATDSSYTIVNADSNLNLECRVTAYNLANLASVPVASNLVGPVVGVPVRITAPEASGSFVVGQTVSVTTGTWAGKTPITFAYQWQRNNGNIAGATNSTYLLVTADLGFQIRCIVTATNIYGSDVYATINSPAVTAPAVNPPVNTVLPVASGNLIVGSVVSCTQGTWTGNEPITYSYQWRRDGQLTGNNSSTYTLAAIDVGALMSCMVTASNAAIGGGSTFVNSNSICPVSAGGWDPATVLFGAGEQGGIWDPSDFSTMFQDSEGTIPVTAVEQPVGRINDKSGRNNHATQPTAASRPVLRARYNLLTFSEQFDNAVWDKAGGAVVPNDALAPNNTLTADKYTSINNGNVGCGVNFTFLAGVIYTIIIYVKYIDNQWFRFNTFGNSGAWFDILNGVAGSRGNIITASNITNAGNGWYLINMTAQSVTGVTGEIGFGLSAANGSNTEPTNKSAHFWGADIRPANEYTVGLPYQRIAGATDYDTVGFPFYLQTDGADDGFVTPAINFSTIDEMSVFVGVRKLSDAAQSAVVELTASIATNNGGFLLSAPFSADANYGFSSKGTTRVDNTVSPYAAPRTDVVTCLADISIPSNIVRVDGAQVGSVVTSQGTGNYANAALNIGRRSDNTLRLNGRLYPLIVRGAATSVADRNATETWINERTKAY